MNFITYISARLLYDPQPPAEFSRIKHLYLAFGVSQCCYFEILYHFFFSWSSLVEINNMTTILKPRTNMEPKISLITFSTEWPFTP